MLYAVLLLLTFCHGVLSSALEPGVSLANGQFIGVRNETSDLTIFYGIPFAAPPVGDLRWRAPEPPASNPNATFNATDNLRSAICPQAIVASIMTTNFSTSTETPYSEDCLSLTVYTPGMPDSDDGNPETPYAVVVYLHGGGYTLGDHSQNNPEAYLELVPQDVVAVVPNYRLGLFGFLAGNAVKENGVLNAGLLDQQFALKWVQDNIHLFNGDPTRVTIWGESAGGGSVLQHVIANNGSTEPPLFVNGVANSPFLPFQYHYNDTVPEMLYKNLTDAVGCTNATDSLACLRSRPLKPEEGEDDLESANFYIARASEYGTFTWVPVVDGDFIVDRPSVMLERGQLNAEKIITTHNAWEGISFADPYIVEDNFTTYISQLVPTINASTVAALASLYPLEDYTSAYQRSQSFYQDPIFLCPSYWMANAFGENAYKAIWNVLPAYHGQDASYYFAANTSALQSYTTFQNWVGDIMSFVRTASPVAYNGSSVEIANPNTYRYNSQDAAGNVSLANPTWASWEPGMLQLGFNVTSQNISNVTWENVDQALLKRCDFWKSIGNATGQ